MAKQITLDELAIKQEIMEIIKKYGKLPEDFRFDPDIFDLNKALGVNKTAKLLYDGKKDKRLILDKTISAPFQEIRKFGESKEKSDIEGEKYWHNKLIYGDNLQALKYLLDNGYKEKIKLIYIDPPFATKSDFIKGEAKAYKDKLDGASFIESMRERLILMKELLSEDGSIYVHLDEKLNHYIKVILDELFVGGFQREIIWRIGWISGYKSKAKNWIRNHDTIYFYVKDRKKFTFNKDYIPYAKDYVRRDGAKPTGEGYPIEDTWNCNEIDRLDSIQIMSFSSEKTGYPTQKNENLLMRIIEASSNKNEIVLDAFVGSATTCAVAEKLNRRWIGIDAGKLAIYTSQKRILDIKNHKPFVVMNSGVYEIKDIDKQVKIDKALYKEFACDLFQVDKTKKEVINGIVFDGKYGNNFVYVFDNEGKIFKQDLEELEERLKGRLMYNPLQTCHPIRFKVAT